MDEIKSIVIWQIYLSFRLDPCGEKDLKEDILWEKFVLKYVSHLKYFQLYFNMLGRKAIRLLAFFFFCSNIPLIPTAKLPSNPVSPSCKASLTSGPQLLLQCSDPSHVGHYNLLTGPLASTSLLSTSCC